MMDEVVLDSGVAVKWYTAEDHTERARAVFHDYNAGIIDLIAPDLIYAEFGNIIWKKQLFQGLPEPDARTMLSDFRAVPLRRTAAADLLEDAYRIAVTHQRSVYDSLYLALNIRQGCRFVTADERLVNAVGGAFPNVVWLANWP